jgi:phosphate transport system protein
MARIATGMVHDVLDAFVERDAAAAVRVCERDQAVDDFYDSIFRTLLTYMMENPHNIEPVSLMPEMARIATEMVHDVLNAFVERDAEAAVRVVERDRAVDDFYNSIFRALLTFMMENPSNIGQSTHLLFIAKNVERVGDHATNIAEMVYFASTGEHLADRPRGHSPLDPQ